jgi:hypothetical protein
MARNRRPVPRGAPRSRASVRGTRASFYHRVLDAGRTLVGVIARSRRMRAANDPEAGE